MSETRAAESDAAARAAQEAGATAARDVLRQLPSVNQVLAQPAIEALVDEYGRAAVRDWVRDELQAVRDACLQTVPAPKALPRTLVIDQIADRLVVRAELWNETRFGGVINATGVVLHTGLGRAPLSDSALRALEACGRAGNLEVDLLTAHRRSRGYQLDPLWQRLTRCEASLVVNNNAAATLLTLQGLCAGREVIISRGQLVEIGGSFRLPDVFALSGAQLREVGTTNRTRIGDYRQAVTDQTAAILHVHTSNYRIEGFTESPGIEALVELCRDVGVLCLDDIGSGCLIETSALGLPAEPTFTRSLAAGADVVLGSGDKLLGGPQAGIILGRRKLLDQLRRHPLSRALRIDKLTLAALQATLESYARGREFSELPVLQLLSQSPEQLLKRAAAVCAELAETPGLACRVERDMAPVGGGTLPAALLPTAVLAVRHDEHSADALAGVLRTGKIRVFARIREDDVLVDLRSVFPQDDSKLALALRLVQRNPADRERLENL